MFDKPTQNKDLEIFKVLISLDFLVIIRKLTNKL